MTAQSVPTVTATATTTVSTPTSEPSDEVTHTGREDSTIQLEDLAESARPFEAVRIQGTYRGGAGTFLRVQRWEGGEWLDFPLPTKTDQAGQFITQAEFGQPGRYRLRVLDPDSGVTSKPFVVVIKGNHVWLSATLAAHRLQPGEDNHIVQVPVPGCVVGATTGDQAQSSVVDCAVNRPAQEPRLRKSGHPADGEDGSFPILSGNGHLIAAPQGA